MVVNILRSITGADTYVSIRNRVSVIKKIYQICSVQQSFMSTHLVDYDDITVVTQKQRQL